MRPRWSSVIVVSQLAMGVGATLTHATAEAATELIVRKGKTQPVFSYADAIRETVYVETPVDSDADGWKGRVATGRRRAGIDYARTNYDKSRGYAVGALQNIRVRTGGA